MSGGRKWKNEKNKKKLEGETSLHTADVRDRKEKERKVGRSTGTVPVQPAEASGPEGGGQQYSCLKY